MTEEKELLRLRIPVPISESMKTEIQQIAHERGQSAAQFIRWVVANYIEAQKHLKIEG